VTIQNRIIPKVRIEKSLNPVVMSLTLAAAELLTLVAVMLIPAAVMSILAVVKYKHYFSLRTGGMDSRSFLIELISKAI